MAHDVYAVSALIWSTLLWFMFSSTQSTCWIYEVLLCLRRKKRIRFFEDLHLHEEFCHVLSVSPTRRMPILLGLIMQYITCYVLCSGTVFLQLVLKFFLFRSLRWMRRSSWALGLKSRGWRAAVEEPRPVIQVRIHILTDPAWPRWVENTARAKKLFISQVRFILCFLMETSEWLRGEERFFQTFLFILHLPENSKFEFKQIWTCLK